jgi:hypothetical protein
MRSLRSTSVKLWAAFVSLRLGTDAARTPVARMVLSLFSRTCLMSARGHAPRVLFCPRYFSAACLIISRIRRTFLYATSASNWNVRQWFARHSYGTLSDHSSKRLTSVDLGSRCPVWVNRRPSAAADLGLFTARRPLFNRQLRDATYGPCGPKRTLLRK